MRQFQHECLCVFVFVGWQMNKTWRYDTMLQVFIINFNYFIIITTLNTLLFFSITIIPLSLVWVELVCVVWQYAEEGVVLVAQQGHWVPVARALLRIMSLLRWTLVTLFTNKDLYEFIPGYVLTRVFDQRKVLQNLLCSLLNVAKIVLNKNVQ